MQPQSLRFGLFEVDVRTGELRKGRTRIRLQKQSAEILLFLLQPPGQLVTREELQQKLWPDGVFVDFDHALNAAVNRLRARLGDTAEKPRFIETLPGRGYRFIGPVEMIAPAGDVEPSIPVATDESPPGLGPLRQRPLPVPRRTVAIAAALIAAVIAGGAYGRWSRLVPRSHPEGQPAMLAVLPVRNLSGDPGRDYISDGLTEELIARLGGQDPQHLRVIGRTSSILLPKSGKPQAQIGQELGVNYILESTMRGSGEDVSISARLIRTGDQRLLWSAEYKRTMRDLAGIREEISRAVADTIGLGLASTREAGLTGPARGMNSDAYQDYLRGRFFWNQRTQEGFLKARAYFEQAIEKDPGHPLGYAGLADAYLGLNDYDVLPPKEAVPRAKAAAQRAIALDPSSAEAHATLAASLCEFDWDVRGAESEFRRAIALNPSYPTAYQWYGECMLWVGRIEESQIEFQRARELDPLSPIISRNEGLPLFFGRRYDDYLEFCRKTLAVDSAFWPNHFSLAWVYELKKDWNDAIAEFEKANRLSESPLTLAHLAHVYARAGRRHDAEMLLAKLKDMSKQRYVPAVHIAMVYEGLGETDKAFEWLEKAYEERYWWMIQLKIDPRWDRLRSDARFHSLLKRVGISED